MAKHLFIDSTKCDECAECTIKCSYFYQPHVSDHGVIALRELIAYALICRRCENPSCVAACRFEALEFGPDKILKRYNMRCVSCKCCSQACPFGTIYPEVIPFYAVQCDYCMSKLAGGNTSCLSGCAKQAIEYKEVEESPKDGIYKVNDNLYAKAPRFIKENV
jgi:Fe-S-cluster-containing hydrogenase component 2